VIVIESAPLVNGNKCLCQRQCLTKGGKNLVRMLPNIIQAQAGAVDARPRKRVCDKPTLTAIIVKLTV